MEKLLFPQNPSCFRYEDSIKFCYEILRNNYENFPLRFFFIDDKLYVLNEILNFNLKS